MKEKSIQPPSESSPRSPAASEPAASEQRSDLTGQTLADFHVLRRLGQGGMGEVYLAEQISLKRKVALKILRSGLGADVAYLQRFQREAEAVARATHANIVQVYAVGEEKGLRYMALEYVEGRNLREYLEKKGPPETLVALSIMRQVAAALQRAHELGVIHRDIKPENILLTRKGEAKVADFGLSRCFTDEAQPLNLTQTGVSMGTPLYMSPEQVECKTIDHRTDIYSFGVTCYHLFAGHPPFKGQSPFEVAIQHVQNQPPRLADIRPDLPAGLCTLIERMMAKKPDERLQTGREIVKEVSRLRDSLVGVGATSPALTTGPLPPQPGDVVSTQIMPPPRRGRGWLWLGAAGVVLALAGGLVAGWLRQEHSSVSSSSPSPAATPGRSAEHKDRENELRKLVQASAHPENQLQMMAGLNHAIDLGLLYLKDRRLKDADAFFKELGTPKQKEVRPYRIWGELGQAMVLAFQDRPVLSNKLFVKALFWDKGEKSGKFWINTPAIREIMAEALNRNYENAPNRFPPSLEHLRHPPPPKAKPAS
jgi:eukaryotic-like serine/threonine-protein kinase